MSANAAPNADGWTLTDRGDAITRMLNRQHEIVAGMRRQVRWLEKFREGDYTVNRSDPDEAYLIAMSERAVKLARTISELILALAADTHCQPPANTDPPD